MTESFNTLPMPSSDEELKKAMDLCFEQMNRLRVQMARDQADIGRLKQETRAILTQSKAA